jgi:phage I-like protein
MPGMHRKTSVTLAAAPCATALAIAPLRAANGQLQAPTRVQLVPAGQFASRDGRPAPGRAWQLGDAMGQALATKLNARHAAPRPSFGFDYEHQSLHAEKNGQPAPRSASMRSFEWVAGDGLYATDVDWTDKGAAAVLAKEYGYVSPVLIYDKNDYVVHDVFNAAVVHTPALLDLSGLAPQFSDPVALGASLLSALNNPGGHPVNPLLKALLAALGLPETATEAQGTAAMAALQAQAATGTAALAAVASACQVDAATLKDGAAVTAALSVHATALADRVKAETTTSVTAALAAKPGAGGSGGGADAGTLQMVAALQAQVVALQATLDGDKVTTLVDDALKARKLLPVQRQWAIDLGKKDMAALGAFVTAAPVLAPGAADSQAAGAAGGGTGVAALSADQKAIAAQLGIDPAEYAKTLVADAA